MSSITRRVATAAIMGALVAVAMSTVARSSGNDLDVINASVAETMRAIRDGSQADEAPAVMAAIQAGLQDLGELAADAPDHCQEYLAVNASMLGILHAYWAMPNETRAHDFMMTALQRMYLDPGSQGHASLIEWAADRCRMGI